MPAPGRLVLENTDRTFVPRVAVVPVGTTLETVNRDAVLHTVHLYGAQESNLALPVEGMRVSTVLNRPGFVQVLCDVHGWMRAWIHVADHTYHAVTDKAGRFRITGLPPGPWELEIVVAAPSQVAADLLTSPGRGPQEGEALIERMKGAEDDWRRSP